MAQWHWPCPCVAASARHAWRVSSTALNEAAAAQLGMEPSGSRHGLRQRRASDKNKPQAMQETCSAAQACRTQVPVRRTFTTNEKTSSSHCSMQRPQRTQSELSIVGGIPLGAPYSAGAITWGSGHTLKQSPHLVHASRLTR
jgi:hypothetical protein